MIKTKQHIALILSSLAMLALLLHGMLPHHHHDAEAEKCNIEEHLTVSGQTCANQTNTIYRITNCSEDHHSDAEQAHVCTLNVDLSKQISLEFNAVISSYKSQNKTSQSRQPSARYSEIIIPTLFYEVRSLRAPPLS